MFGGLVPHQLCIDVHSGHVVNDTANLILGLR